VIGEEEEKEELNGGERDSSSRCVLRLDALLRLTGDFWR
jgi:hypothetical protein